MKRVVFNQKGGVGKSSITVNLAAISASKGLKTLVIDLDTQCNASQYLLGMDIYQTAAPTPNIGDYFNQTLSFRLKEKSPMEFVHTTQFESLFVIPASPELGELQYQLERKHKIYKFRSMLRSLGRQFDVIYIDTPPAFNFYTLSALIGADKVLIPFDCDAFAKDSIFTLMENILETKADHNETLEVEGVIINQYQSRARIPAQLVEELKETELPILEPYLSSSVIMRESHSKAMPLIHLAPNHKLTKEFIALHDGLTN